MSATAENVFDRRSAYLLRDAEGVYGLRVEAGQGYYEVHARADKADRWAAPDLFHSIPRGRPQWSRGREAGAVDALHERLVEKAGLHRCASENRSQRERQAWFGYRSLAEKTVNSLLLRLHAEAVPPARLSTIRRYPVQRGNLYVGLCRGGDRAWQLAETFPMLVFHLYHEGLPDSKDRQKAKRMVRNGARLRFVADAVSIPMAFRRFPPAVAKLAIKALDVLAGRPDIVENYAPSTVPRMRAWLRAIIVAKQRSNDHDYALWVARHGLKLEYWRNAFQIAGDIGDWVQASRDADKLSRLDPEQMRLLYDLVPNVQHFIDDAIHRGRKYGEIIARPFCSEMAPQTVIALSDQWHEDVSRLNGVADVQFPAPWYPAGEIGGYKIKPIGSADELVKLARVFRNCAATYAHSIEQGDRYLYLVSEDEPAAILELLRGNKPVLGQVKGPCNKVVPKSLEKAAKAWLSKNKRAHGVGEMPAQELSHSFHLDEFDVPF